MKEVSSKSAVTWSAHSELGDPLYHITSGNKAILLLLQWETQEDARKQDMAPEALASYWVK